MHSDYDGIKLVQKLPEREEPQCLKETQFGWKDKMGKTFPGEEKGTMTKCVQNSGSQGAALQRTKVINYCLAGRIWVQACVWFDLQRFTNT